ncbi:hypothetical protein LPB140_03160 [Sphingorhabdus lutea]|uniref:GspL periplasmic domain-containing protein n=2 Tax=Sphingorhabdus lutea TaxID=1913578 RepID=A0A1L3JA94_9SPHN|nr:hypothetical protein LPB140_03160 [Sphingorhabdus lutea]
MDKFMSRLLILSFPVQGDVPIGYYRVENASIVDFNIIPPNDKDAISALYYWVSEDISSAKARVIALASPGDVVVHWHEIDDMPDKQALMVAQVKLQEKLPVKTNLHISAKIMNVDMASSSDKKLICTAHIDAEKMERGLKILAGYNLDPDIVMPIGMAISMPHDGYKGAEIFGIPLILGPQFIAPDEAALRTAFHIDENLVQHHQNEICTDMAALNDADNLPRIINLRHGPFAMGKAKTKWGAGQLKIILFLCMAALLVSLALAVASWGRLYFAVQHENGIALKMAQKIIPNVDNIEEAQNALSNKDIAKNGTRFALLSSAIYGELEKQPALQLRQLKYDQNQILYATITAPTNDAINPLLINLQQQGYKITATPKQEQGGLSSADISMRLP